MKTTSGILIPPCPTDDTTMHPPVSGNHDPTRAQVEYCWRAIWEHFGETEHDKKKLANGYYEHQRFYAPEAWLEALRETSRRGKTMIRTISYVESIAADYDANGIPERKPAPGLRNTGIPSAPKRDSVLSLYPKIVIDEQTRAKYANPKKPTPLGEGIPPKAAAGA